MKLDRDEVLIVPYKCCCFRPGESRVGRINGGGGAKYVRGPFFNIDPKATATNGIHSIDLIACCKKCSLFWFHF